MIAPGSTEMRDAGDLDMAEEFAGLARLLNAAGDVDHTVSLICSMAADRLPRRSHAGVSVVDTRRRVITRGGSDSFPPAVDRWQYETGQGPGLEAIWTRDIVAVPDLLVDERWPEFAAHAVADTGVRSMMSFRLFTEDRVLGGLNLYSEAAGAFLEDSPIARWGKVYASHASVALDSARAQSDLRAALESRETISVAIGLLMAREGVNREQAFDMLRRASQRMNVKLRDVAARVAGGQPPVLAGDN